MVVVQHNVGSRDLPQPFNHKAHHLREMGLTCRNMPGVDVDGLEGSKEQLAGAGIVAIRA